MSTIITFQDWVSDKEIDEFLIENELQGIRASVLKKRYVVEMLSGKKLTENPIIKNVKEIV